MGSVEDHSHIVVSIPVMRKENYMYNVLEWCNSEFGKYNHQLTWKYLTYSHTLGSEYGVAIFKFASEADAALFALRWS